MLATLQRSMDRISCERILRVPGIKNIYASCEITRKVEEPGIGVANSNERRPRKPSFPDFAKRRWKGTAAICDQPVDFVSRFGASGTCAPEFHVHGWNLIGGSLSAKIVPKIKTLFVPGSFSGQGRMATILRNMPVKIVANG